MMVSGECISMWENGRSRQSLEEPYFKKCFRRKTHKKRYITEHCYLRARYVLTCEKISWKRRYASVELSKASIICHSARFSQQNTQCVWMQPPVAHNSRPLRRRQPSKTGIHAIQNLFPQNNNKIWGHKWLPLLLSESCVDLSPPPQATEN